MNRARRNLRLRGRKWQFYREIPADLRETLGKRFIIVTLGTSDFAKAQQARDKLLQSTTDLFKTTRKKLKEGEKADLRALEEEALRMREAIENDPDDDSVLELVASDRAEQIEKQYGLEQARAWYLVATGRQTPITEALIERFMTETNVVASTAAARRIAIQRFRDFLQPAPNIERVDRRLAGQYASHLVTTLKLLPRTHNAHISHLSSFWRWLIKRGLAQENPWAGQQLSVKGKRGSVEQKGSPWTLKEVRVLIQRAPDALLRDCIKIAALSGLRVSELFELRVRDVRDGLFHVNEGKTQASIRAVPIHSELKEIIERRTTGKKPDDYLIEEIRRDTRGALRRSAVFVKRFGRYRDRVFPEYRQNGHRQAAKVFHDLRAHFIDERLKRGIPIEVVRDCVGHEQEGVTMRHYATRSSLEQLRECVEAVSLKPANTQTAEKAAQTSGEHTGSTQASL